MVLGATGISLGTGRCLGTGRDPGAIILVDGLEVGLDTGLVLGQGHTPALVPHLGPIQHLDHMAAVIVKSE